MKLRDAINLFLDEQRPTTRKSYYYVMINMQEYIGPAKPIDEIKSEHLIEYAQNVRSRDYASATIQKYIKTFKTFFNWLVKMRLLQYSPAQPIKGERLKRNIERSKAMTDEELEKILEFARWKPRDYALVLFLADTGCRASGAAGLTIDDLNLSEHRATVTEKGDKMRLVSYGDESAAAIARWLLQRNASAGVYVFSHNGNRMISGSLSKVVRRLSIKVGIRSLGPHSMRHRKGHQLADAKVAPSVAATALGHDNPTITLEYYYPADWGRAEEELRKLVIKTSPAKVIHITGK